MDKKQYEEFTAKLIAEGVHYLIGEFSGSGDSGWIEDYAFLDNNEDKLGDIVAFDVFQPVARAEWDTLFFFYGVVQEWTILASLPKASNYGDKNLSPQFKWRNAGVL